MPEKLKNQKGSALLLVIIMFMILGILGFVAVSVAENQTLMVNRHQQSEKALHYAEAGAYKYMAELNQDFSFYTTEESNHMLGTDTAFEKGYYKLELDLPTTSKPHITIRSTGWVKDSDIKRTVEMDLHKKSFLQNLITANVGNSRFPYANRFMRGDVVHGPLHMNGDLIINGHTGDGFTGPIFYGPVSYSGDLIKQRIPSTAKDETQYHAGEPVKVDRVHIPTSNEHLRLKADYVFTGRTCIYIDGDRLKVRNRDDKNTTANITIPEKGLVVYVDGGTGNNKWDLDTGNVYISGKLKGRLTVAAENDIYITASDPTNWSKPGVKNSGGIIYDGLEGASFTNQDELDAALAGRNDMLGLIANRNVRILHFNWPTDKSPYYLKDGWLIKRDIDVAPINMNIHGSVCAISGSFEYEEPKEGSRKENLTVIGSISQHSIGPVGGYAVNILDLPENMDVFNKRLHGYGKNYWYDSRLMYQSPPNFIDPANSGWEMVEWREISNSVAAEPEP